MFTFSVFRRRARFALFGVEAEAENEPLSVPPPAKDALNGVLAVDLDNKFPIPAPKYTGGYAIEVEPKIAFAITLRSCRAKLTQREVASKIGMSYQQYQKLENPNKANPTLETLYKLQKVFNRPFLAL